jgi:hypothetical protein
LELIPGLHIRLKIRALIREMGGGHTFRSEFVLLKLLRSLGIDSQPINVYKYELCLEGWGAGDGRRPLRSKYFSSCFPHKEGGGEGKIIRQTCRQKKRIGIQTAMVFKIGVAGGCFSLSLSTHTRDLDVSNGPKKVYLFR